MITSRTEYNELLYAINDPNNQTETEVPIGEDGYPIIEFGRIYCYYIEEDCFVFGGTQETLKERWPDPKDVPPFFERTFNYQYRIPADEPIYKIDLNSRKVESPKNLSVVADNNAEVLWFSVDRFYDDVDLFDAVCWVQYKNALGETYISMVSPQVIGNYDHNLLYIPWPVTAAATKAAGNVSFSFQFFKVSEDQQRVYYSINTQVATAKVVDTLRVEPLTDVSDGTIFYPEYSQLESTFRWMAQKLSDLDRDYELYWCELQ